MAHEFDSLSPVIPETPLKDGDLSAFLQLRVILHFDASTKCDSVILNTFHGIDAQAVECHSCEFNASMSFFAHVHN